MEEKNQRSALWEEWWVAFNEAKIRGWKPDHKRDDKDVPMFDAGKNARDLLAQIWPLVERRRRGKLTRRQSWEVAEFLLEIGHKFSTDDCDMAGAVLCFREAVGMPAGGGVHASNDSIALRRALDEFIRTTCLLDGFTVGSVLSVLLRGDELAKMATATPTVATSTIIIDKGKKKEETTEDEKKDGGDDGDDSDPPLIVRLQQRQQRQCPQ